MEVNINQLFFELIQVAIGMRTCLSHTPSVDEWGELYAMAKKQSLVGVCFAGVQRLQQQRQEPPEMLYLTWMGMAAKIQQRNEVANQQCVELQSRLSADGMDSVVLKGQGVAQYYDPQLRTLRQSGDIDIYVKGGFRKVVATAQRIAPLGKASYVHVDWKVFEDPSTNPGGSTEVELHYRPSSLRNLIKNSRFQKWAMSFGAESYETRGDIVIPPVEFNRIYLLMHCYRHVIGAGIGLRQLMDYYFCLRSEKLTLQERTHYEELLRAFGLSRFAGAVMYVMAEVFRLDSAYMICELDVKEGEFFLKQTLIGGNFGRYDNRVERNSSGGASIMRKLFMNLRYALHYPDELLWAIPFRVYTTIWKKTHKI